jgi:hypothetical protein
MSESADHTSFVDEIVRFIERLTHPRSDLVVYRDGPETTPQKLPPKLGGYRPDVLARLWRDHTFFIGEAKTSSDLGSSRTVAQLTAFLAEVAQNPKGTFILCAPFASYPTARSLLWSLSPDVTIERAAIYCIHPGLSSAAEAKLVRTK